MTRVIRFTSRSSGSPQQSLAMGVNGGSILDMISQLFGSGSSSSDNAPPMDLRMLMNGGSNGNGNVGFGDYYMGDMSALLQHIRENFEPPPHFTPAAKTAVSALKPIDITEKHISECEACAVCKDAYETDQKALMLPCDHMFH